MLIISKSRHNNWLNILIEWLLFGKPSRISFIRKHNSSYCGHEILCPRQNRQSSSGWLLTAQSYRNRYVMLKTIRRIGFQCHSLSFVRNTFNQTPNFRNVNIYNSIYQMKGNLRSVYYNLFEEFRLLGCGAV
jgi:hypothetical protein